MTEQTAPPEAVRKPLAQQTAGRYAAALRIADLLAEHQQGYDFPEDAVIWYDAMFRDKPTARTLYTMVAAYIEAKG